MSLTISQRETQGIVVLDLGGRLIFEESAALHARVKDLLEGNHRKILVNMEDVSFCGSSGIAALAGVYVSVRNCEGEIKFANVHKRIWEVLDVTRLNTLLDLYDSEEEALASFGA